MSMKDIKFKNTMIELISISEKYTIDHLEFFSSMNSFIFKIFQYSNLSNQKAISLLKVLHDDLLYNDIIFIHESYNKLLVKKHIHTKYDIEEIRLYLKKAPKHNTIKICFEI